MRSRSSRHDFNPHYFLNPPAYSYLLHIVFELWFGSADAVTRAYTSDPTQVFVVARVVAAVLGTVAVWLTYLAGARFFNNRTIGLLAAAILGFAFLPVFYSHLALNDVPTLAPVSLALYGTAGVMRRGRMRDYAIAGAGVGLAAATKYTGGITILCLLTAFVTDASGGSMCERRRRRCAIGAGDRPGGVPDRQPVRDPRLLGVQPRRQLAGLAGGRRGPGEARHAGRQRDRVLPVDVHLGPGLGSDDRRDRRRGAADRAAADRDGR